MIRDNDHPHDIIGQALTQARAIGILMSNGYDDEEDKFSTPDAYLRDGINAITDLVERAQEAFNRLVGRP